MSTILLTSEDIKTAITDLIDETASDTPVLISVAYWGENSELLLPNNRNYKLVCNLESKGTNPAVVRTLLLRTDIQIKSHRNLHAKVAIGQKSAVLGSANFSNSALGIERASTLLEVSVVITEPQLLEQLRDWFWRVSWTHSSSITETMLQSAEAAWDQSPSGKRALVSEIGGLEKQFLKSGLTGENQIRMASKSMTRLYETHFGPLGKVQVRVPAFAANLLWVYLGNKVDTRFSSGFANTSEVWARILDPAAKQPKYLMDEVCQFIDLLAEAPAADEVVRMSANYYREDGYPGKPIV